MKAFNEESVLLKKLLAESMLNTEDLNSCSRPKVLTPRDKDQNVRNMLSRTAIFADKARSVVLRYKGAMVNRGPLVFTNTQNLRCSRDLAIDFLANDRKVKYLTIVDGVAEERLDIHVVTAISGDEAACTLDGIAAFRIYPNAVGTDEGLDFTGKALDQ